MIDHIEQCNRCISNNWNLHINKIQPVCIEPKDIIYLLKRFKYKTTEKYLMKVLDDPNVASNLHHFIINVSRRFNLSYDPYFYSSTMNVCSLCMSLDKLSYLKCSHGLCLECTEMCFNLDGKCPVCQDRIYVDFHYTTENVNVSYINEDFIHTILTLIRRIQRDNSNYGSVRRHKYIVNKFGEYSQIFSGIFTNFLTPYNYIISDIKKAYVNFQEYEKFYKPTEFYEYNVFYFFFPLREAAETINNILRKKYKTEYYFLFSYVFEKSEYDSLLLKIEPIFVSSCTKYISLFENLSNVSEYPSNIRNILINFDIKVNNICAILNDIDNLYDKGDLCCFIEKKNKMSRQLFEICKNIFYEYIENKILIENLD